jgi:hypothetical protein
MSPALAGTSEQSYANGFQRANKGSGVINKYKLRRTLKDKQS